MATNRRAIETSESKPVAVTSTAAAEAKLEDFAEDLGKLLGHAQNKAEGWLNQRKTILENLTGLRDTANRLIAQLGGAEAVSRRAARYPGTPIVKRAPGRPKGSGKRKRTISAEAREKIAAAQRARWAKQKATTK
jgi:hypothetical protein